MTRIEWLKNIHFKENKLAFLWLSSREKILLEYENPQFVYEYFRTYPELKDEFETALEELRARDNSTNNQQRGGEDE